MRSYQWFIVALEFVVATACLVVVSNGQLAKYRASLIGLLAIATLLWINMSNAFLSAELAQDGAMTKVSICGSAAVPAACDAKAVSSLATCISPGSERSPPPMSYMYMHPV